MFPLYFVVTDFEVDFSWLALYNFFSNLLSFLLFFMRWIQKIRWARDWWGKEGTSLVWKPSSRKICHSYLVDSLKGTYFDKVDNFYYVSTTFIKDRLKSSTFWYSWSCEGEYQIWCLRHKASESQLYLLDSL